MFLNEVFPEAAEPESAMSDPVDRRFKATEERFEKHLKGMQETHEKELKAVNERIQLLVSLSGYLFYCVS